jgi:hypothetical protein
MFGGRIARDYVALRAEDRYGLSYDSLYGLLSWW